jgi:hypothetical protein
MGSIGSIRAVAACRSGGLRRRRRARQPGTLPLVQDLEFDCLLFKGPAQCFQFIGETKTRRPSRQAEATLGLDTHVHCVWHSYSPGRRRQTKIGTILRSGLPLSWSPEAVIGLKWLRKAYEAAQNREIQWDGLLR